jgi:uncharacterized peroxidase-related enzyme
MQHHGGSLRQLTGDEVLVDEIMRDPLLAPVPKRLRAILDYAVKLTTTPHAMTPCDVDALRHAGLSDAGIHDVAAVTAYFNFVNRMAQGLGVELEK